MANEIKTIDVTYGKMDIVQGLEPSHSSMTIRREHTPSNPKREYVKLYIQSIDAYAYQRELVLNYGHVPGNADKCEWALIAYQHPCRRRECIVSDYVAKSLIARLIKYATEYPTLLFNPDFTRPDGVQRACNYGFVHFHDALLNGAEVSVRLLG